MKSRKPGGVGSPSEAAALAPASPGGGGGSPPPPLRADGRRRPPASDPVPGPGPPRRARKAAANEVPGLSSPPRTETRRGGRGAGVGGVSERGPTSASGLPPRPPIDVLSLDALGAVLAFLPLEERCTTAPLVCKAFHAALRASGDLYARLSIDARRAPAASSAGLAAWVARRAGRVHTLVLTVPPCAPGALLPGPARAVATAVGACAAPLPLRVPGDTMFGGRGPAAPAEPPLREVILECREGGGPAGCPPTAAPLGALGAWPPALAAARCATTLTLRAARFETGLPAWVGDLAGLEALTLDGAHPPDAPGVPPFFPVQMLALSRLTRLEVLGGGGGARLGVHTAAEAAAAAAAALAREQRAVAARLAAAAAGAAAHLPPPPPPPGQVGGDGADPWRDGGGDDGEVGAGAFLAGVRARGAGGVGGAAWAAAAAAHGAAMAAAAAVAAGAGAGRAPPPGRLVPVDGAPPPPHRRRQAHPQPRGVARPIIARPAAAPAALPAGRAGLGGGGGGGGGEEEEEEAGGGGEDLFGGGGGHAALAAAVANPAAAAAAAVAAQAARLFAGGRPGRVVAVPPVLGELPALRRLAIRDAAGVAFHPAAFQRGAFACAGLVDLALTDCGLVSVPHQVAGMAGLTRLDVSGNRGLSVLPPLLAPGVRGLRALSAAGCDLARLPPALTRLTALTALDLSDNPRLQVGGGEAPAPLAAARRDVSLAQLLAALPTLATLDLRSAPAGPGGGPPLPKRWSAASLAQLRLVGAPPGYGGEVAPSKAGGGGGGRSRRKVPPGPATGIAVSAPSGALRWGGTLLLPRASAARAARVGVARRASAGSA